MWSAKSILTLAILLFFALPMRILSAQSEPPPRILILSPAPGEVISGTAVKVIVQLPPGMILTDPAAHPNPVDGQGHLHVWLDAAPNHDDGLSIVLTKTSEYTYQKVFSGLHAVYAEFYGNDHASYGTRYLAKVEFETVNEEIRPAKPEGNEPSAPESTGGLFLPPGRGKTFISIIITVFVIGVLWLTAGRPQKRGR